MESEASMTVFKNGRGIQMLPQPISETKFRAVFLAYFPRLFLKNGHANSVVKSAFCSSEMIWKSDLEQRKSDENSVHLTFELPWRCQT
ncbi:hypothetical protein TIFTF001_027289 [Ficus carica]|uniref:Uncharacterized protein n=1 Tax=Ficus carica TaxID=3494 RepID=A0AA88J021_FICCA|nr:hypothetical protein TIFTF001_027289 [Ficus carica]